MGYNGEKGKDWVTHTADPQVIWETLVDVYKEHGSEDYLPMLKEYLIQYANEVGKITDWKGY